MFKKFLSAILSLAMVFSLVTSSFAATVSEDAETSSNVVIVDDGIYINDTFYSQSEFLELLDAAIEISTPRPYAVAPAAAAAGSLVAGTWWIPGVGEVLITAAGVIIVGGVVIGVGTWIYNAVTQWFADRAEKEAYEKAKQSGTPANNHSTQKGGSSLPPEGDPNSSKDHEVNGVIKQRRYYGEDGYADMDIDYTHSGVKHVFPHRHYWVNHVRGDAVPF